jgi:hypothetical protein
MENIKASRPLLLSTLARALGVSPGWLAGEAEAGRIPALRAGRDWLCDPDAVEAVLLERARRPVPTRKEAVSAS